MTQPAFYAVRVFMYEKEYCACVSCAVFCIRKNTEYGACVHVLNHFHKIDWRMYNSSLSSDSCEFKSPKIMGNAESDIFCVMLTER